MKEGETKIEKNSERQKLSKKKKIRIPKTDKKNWKISYIKSKCLKSDEKVTGKKIEGKHHRS